MKKVVLTLIIATMTLGIIILASAIDIDSCQTLSTEGGTYTLNQSINATGTCINIAANGITINGAGYTINYSKNGTVGYGINNTGGYYNITITNLTITQGNTSTNSSAIITNGKNTTIQNNTITTAGNNSYGIQLQNASGGANISANTITTMGSSTIMINASNDNTMSFNNLTTTNAETMNVIVSSNNTITNNTITSNGFSSEAIKLQSSSTNNILSNTITTYGNTSNAITLTTIAGNSSDTNTITANIITTYGNESNGIILNNGSNNQLILNTITTNGNLSAGISMYGNITTIKNNTLQDMNINATRYYPIIWSGGTTINITNVSYTGNKTENITSGEIIRKWWVEIIVRDESSNPLSGANVTAINNSNTTHLSVLTNTAGTTGAKQLIEYTNTNGTITLSNIYNISTTKTGYTQTITQTNLSSYTSEERGNKALNLTITSTSTSSSSGGGSGSGGTSGFHTYTISEGQLLAGYNKVLYYADKIRANLSGQYHSIMLIKVTSTGATINVSSTPQQKIFLIGDSNKFDVNTDGQYDIEVQLIGINTTDGWANVTVTKTSGASGTAIPITNNNPPIANNEQKSVGSGTLGEEKIISSSTWWTIGIIITIVVIAIIVALIITKYQQYKEEQNNQKVRIYGNLAR